mgnify:CR=1 FL=1
MKFTVRFLEGFPIGITVAIPVGFPVKVRVGFRVEWRTKRAWHYLLVSSGAGEEHREQKRPGSHVFDTDKHAAAATAHPTWEMLLWSPHRDRHKHATAATAHPKL